MARSGGSRAWSVAGSREGMVTAEVVCAANTTQTPACCSPVPRYASTSSVRSTTSSLLVVVTVRLLVDMRRSHLNAVCLWVNCACSEQRRRTHRETVPLALAVHYHASYLQMPSI